MPTTNQDSALAALYRAVDEVNLTLAAEDRIKKSPDTILLGSDSTIESIALINLIVETEFVLTQDFGADLNLGEVRAEGDSEHPFRTLGSMAGYIAAALQAGN